MDFPMDDPKASTRKTKDNIVRTEYFLPDYGVVVEAESPEQAAEIAARGDVTGEQ